MVRRRARALALRCLGPRGILDGQARDLHSPDDALVRPDALGRAAGKSVPMLTLALELPAVVAQAPRAHSDALGRLAHCLGLAYQLLDDLEDMASGASGKEAANATTTLGRRGTQFAVRQTLARGRSIAQSLVSSRPVLEKPFAAVFDRLDQWSTRFG
jgi:geranylgeranyl pyrophosphate synthase